VLHQHALSAPRLYFCQGLATCRERVHHPGGGIPEACDFSNRQLSHPRPPLQARHEPEKIHDGRVSAGELVAEHFLDRVLRLTGLSGICARLQQSQRVEQLTTMLRRANADGRRALKRVDNQVARRIRWFLAAQTWNHFTSALLRRARLQEYRRLLPELLRFARL
jgi:hypothetical protein